MTNVLITIILVAIVLVALRGSVKHFKGEGACCGGGGSTVKEPDKKLDGPVIRTVVFKIDGMHCENCVSRVKRAVNRIDGVSAKVNLRKKTAEVSFEKDVDDAVIISAIEELGYTVKT